MTDAIRNSDVPASHLARPDSGCRDSEQAGGRFDSADWLSFGAAVFLTLAVYFASLAPDVDLGFSGIFSVGAMYAGVPHPPGYPLWTLYSWLFTVLLPFSNIAWRAAVASAVAGALACGVVALMVSRGGALILGRFPASTRLSETEGRLLRVVCGCVAGAALGFDNGLWRKAVIADPWPLSLLLLALVLCLLMKWSFAPQRRRWLYAAFFAYGLAITNSQALIPAAAALPVIVALRDRHLGRDFFLASGVVFLCGWLAKDVFATFHSEPGRINSAFAIFLTIGFGVVAAGASLAVVTRKVFTEWKAVLISGAALALGLALYLYVPIASMTNPPINWSYPRTVEGFSHNLTRGQYEKVLATDNLGVYARQMGLYARMAMADFGLSYLLAALISWCCLPKMGTSERRWMLGLLAVFACLSCLMVALLNPAPDLYARDALKVFFSASHVILAIWAGYGLVVLGALVSKPRAMHGQPSGQRYN